jgi:hypothetical protein
MEKIKYSLRQATVSDAAVIARHRVEMFRDMGPMPTDTLATELLEASTAALDAVLRDGSYVGWLAQGYDRVLLHASDAGRPLYESLGFVPTNEMRYSPVTPATG